MLELFYNKKYIFFDHKVRDTLLKSTVQNK